MMLQNKLSLWMIVQLLGFAINICQGVDLGWDCSATACTADNSHCVGDVCLCETGFIEDAGACLKGLLETCENADECISNALCAGSAAKLCICDKGYVQKEGLCSKVTGSVCTAQNEDTVCRLTNAECKDGVCVCEDGYAGDVICSKVLGSSCTEQNENTVCSLTNTECKEGVCACKAGYTGDPTCSKIIGSDCSGTGSCSGDVNAICKENKCECNEDSAEKNDVCTLTVSGTACSSDTECKIDNAVCDTETSKCKCDADFTMNIDKCDPKNAAAMAGIGAIVLSLSVLTARLMMF